MGSFSGCGSALEPGFDVAAAPADGAGAELDGPRELVAADHLVDGRSGDAADGDDFGESVDLRRYRSTGPGSGVCPCAVVSWGVVLGVMVGPSRKRGFGGVAEGP